MKLLTTVLLLALLAGCQASPLGKQSTSRLEQVKDAISHGVFLAFAATMELIGDSELGQEIEQWRLERKTQDLFEELANKLPPWVQEKLSNLSRRADVLMHEIETELRKLGQKVVPYKEQLQATLESCAEEPLEMAEHYGKTLLGGPMSSIFPSKVEMYEKLDSYAQELGLQELQRGMAAYARDLHQTLSPYTEELGGWLTSRWDSLMQWFQ